MLQAIELIIHRTVHVTIRIRRPLSHIPDRERERGRAQLQVIHPVAIIPPILVPPTALILCPVTTTTAAEQKTLLVIVELHFNCPPPADRVQITPDLLGHHERPRMPHQRSVKQADRDRAYLVGPCR